MDLKKLSDKSIQAIHNLQFLTILEGAVRSTKTVTANLAFLTYVLLSSEHYFLLTGHTMGSVSRNCIDGDYGIVNLSGGLAKKASTKENTKYLDIAGKIVYYGGADTKASFKRFRGLTIGGWMGDEINLHHPEAVDEFLRRSLVSKDRKNIWTLNPEAPSHWIYKNYIDKYLEEKTSGVNWYHFTLDDNPVYTEERKAEIKEQYSGLFYQRYILGRRVRAEGACYPSFTDSVVVSEIPKLMYSIIGADIGGSGSATAYCNAGFYFNDKNKLCVIIINELYDNENKSTESVLQNFKDYSLANKKEYNTVEGYIDSAEQLILKSARNQGILNIKNSLKKPIVDRIRIVDWLISAGRFKIHESCRHTIEAVQSAVWDERHGKETRLDDGSTNIDSLDAMEYAIEREMRNLMT